MELSLFVTTAASASTTNLMSALVFGRRSPTMISYMTTTLATYPRHRNLSHQPRRPHLQLLQQMRRAEGYRPPPMPSFPHHLPLLQWIIASSCPIIKRRHAMTNLLFRLTMCAACQSNSRKETYRPPVSSAPLCSTPYLAPPELLCSTMCHYRSQSSSLPSIPPSPSTNHR
jgi:hypothetical protein